MNTTHDERRHTQRHPEPAVDDGARRGQPAAINPTPARVLSPTHLLLGGIIAAIESLAAQVPGGHGMTQQIAGLRQQLQNLPD